MRDSMIFYRSFYEAIKELSFESQGIIYNAIYEYGLNKNEVELKGIEKTIFTLIKPQLDANLRKFNNGNKGGRPPKNNLNETELKPKNNLNETKKKANVNDNVNNNVNNNNTIESIDYDVFLNTINNIFGRSFKMINVSVRKKYEMLLKQGYTKHQIHNAMLNCKNNDYHKESNYRYCTPEFFSRPFIIDKYGDTSLNDNQNVYVPNEILN